MISSVDIEELKPGDWMVRKWGSDFGNEWDIFIYLRRGSSAIPETKSAIIVKNFLRFKDTTLEFVDTLNEENNETIDTEIELDYPDFRLSVQSRLMTPEEYKIFEPLIKRAKIKHVSENKFGL